MTITQTIDIPADRRITLPHEVPEGRANIIIQFPIQETTIEKPKERVFGCSRGKYRMSDDFDAPLDDFKDYM
ncbi:MAG: DUF2281 domain-containing protein [Treponema sp.]|nr:DUF2281 domain-containing protein [Treponema sp.]